MTEDRIEAVSEFVMKGDFRVTDAIEEMITKGVKAGAAWASRWKGERKKVNTEFTTEKERIVGIGEAIGRLMARETVEG
jgi:hypothetical protein